MSNRNFHFYRWLEVSGEKQFLWLYLDISPLFSHIVNILVQAFLTAYYEIFQTLAVDEDSCSWSRSWTSAVTVSSGGNPRCQKIFPRFKKHMTVPGDQFEAVWWVGKTFPAVQHGSGGSHVTVIAPVGRTSHLHHTRQQSVCECSSGFAFCAHKIE
jgi:hypothetical protein